MCWRYCFTRLRACNFVRGIRTALRTNYHNRAFRKTAEELGLHNRADGSLRLCTHQFDKTEQRWSEQIALLGREIQVFRRWNRKKAGVLKHRTAATCAAAARCGFLIRVSRTTLNQTESNAAAAGRGSLRLNEYVCPCTGRAVPASTG